MGKYDKLELARWVVKQGKKAGADDISVDVIKDRSISVDFRNGKMEELKESSQNYLSLSVFADHRYTSHNTCDLNKVSLEKFIAEAVAMTKYLNEDPYRSLPDQKYYKMRNDIDLNLHDDNYSNVSSEKRVEIAKKIGAMASGLSDSIVNCNSSYSDSRAEFVKINSNGFEGQKEATYFGASVETSVKDGNGGRPSDYDYIGSRFFRDITGLEMLGKTAYKRAVQKIGQKKIKSGVYDMIVENRALSRLLAALESPLMGSSLYRKNSCFENKLAERVASEKLTIVDDPFIVAGFASRLYDGDGMAAKKRPIIEKGILRSYLISWYYSKKLGINPTSGSKSNVTFETGKRSPEEMIKDVKKGIFVTQFVGGNSNSLTGDFSYGIVGLYIENGEIVHPVNEMNISGNIMEFWKKLAEVGNDPYQYSSLMRPSMYFKDVNFSGI
jgi:PmbA protein